MFRGLFIGIDRYTSDAISWLSCAERDASALHSLFADTFGDGGELLTSQEATRAAILGRLDELKGCSEDDGCRRNRSQPTFCAKPTSR
jgi:helicase